MSETYVKGDLVFVLDFGNCYIPGRVNEIDHSHYGEWLEKSRVVIGLVTQTTVLQDLECCVLLPNMRVVCAVIL